MSKKSRYLSRQIKEEVRRRQNYRCACCLENSRLEFHHVNPVCLQGSDTTKNIVALCKMHHKLLHLGDFDTCIAILEYIYYIYYNKLPEDIHGDLSGFIRIIKEDFQCQL